MTGYRLYKKEKLCSLTAIESLFAPTATKAGANNSIIAYPWRAVWRVNDIRSVKCPQFLITVPKKRLRKAVQRVTMRRRMREAYRLHRNLLPESTPVDIAFIYVANDLTDYRHTKKSITKILNGIKAQLDKDPSQP